MAFVYVVPCGLVLVSVYGDTVPNCVLNDKHTYLFKLFAKLLDIKGNNTILDIDVCSVVEHIQRACDVDFKSCCEDTLKEFPQYCASFSSCLRSSSYKSSRIGIFSGMGLLK